MKTSIFLIIGLQGVNVDVGGKIDNPGVNNTLKAGDEALDFQVRVERLSISQHVVKQFFTDIATGRRLSMGRHF